MRRALLQEIDRDNARRSIDPPVPEWSTVRNLLTESATIK
jgi:hypothetical protein